MNKKNNIDFSLMLPAIFATLVITILLVVLPGSKNAVDTIFKFITVNFKWLFLSFGFITVVFLFWLSFSKWGKIKLGKPEEKPQFSTFTWCAMIFCSGIAIGIAYWPFLEPLYYANTPPLLMQPNSTLAKEYSGMLPLFHWGISIWAFSALPTFTIAYAIHVKGITRLRISAACKGILGKYSDKWPGKLIDVLVVFAMIGAVGTSMGLGVPLVAQLISSLTGIQVTVGLQLFILLIWTAFFTLTVWAGLTKGTAKLSNFNTLLAIALLIFTFVMGPTLLILNLFTNSMGILITDFARISLWTDPIANGGFPETWTVFFWAWGVAYAPMMGMFVARISKGRTIKQMILAVLFTGTLGSWVFFAVWGGYSISIVESGTLNIGQMLNDLSKPEVILQILGTMKFAKWLIIPVYTIMCFLFVSTPLNSTAYTLASQCTKNIKGDEEPARWLRTLWGIIIGMFVAGLFMVNGLKVIQLSSIITALPLIPILVILVLSGLKWMKEDYGEILSTKPICLQVENIKKVE